MFSVINMSVFLAPFDRWETVFPPFACLDLMVMILHLFKVLPVTCGPCLSLFIFVCIGFPLCVCSTPSCDARASIIFFASKTLEFVCLVFLNTVSVSCHHHFPLLRLCAVFSSSSPAYPDCTCLPMSTIDLLNPRK